MNLLGPSLFFCDSSATYSVSMLSFAAEIWGVEACRVSIFFHYALLLFCTVCAGPVVDVLGALVFRNILTYLFITCQNGRP